MDYLIIKDGLIDNIIIADKAFAKKINALPCYEGARIGEKYNPPKSANPPSTTDVAEMLLDLETRTSLLEMGVK